MQNWIGKQIGKCRIEQVIGVGGMGTVYKVRHLLLDKIVALKLLNPALVQGDSGKELIERFIREAQAAAKLEHPNIVPIYDVGAEGGIYYIVMQFISGGTLLDLIGTLSMDKIVWIAKEIAKGLQAAHEKGIIHRDIKPANILISYNGEVKITDFGLAKQVDDSLALAPQGRIFGTPHYLSPEQALAEEDLDGRADLYSLGVTMFHTITGSLPYLGDNASEIMQQHLYSPVPSVRENLQNIPHEVEYLIQKMMEKDRNNRFASAAEVIAYIETLEAIFPLEKLKWTSTARLSSTRRLTPLKKQSLQHDIDQPATQPQHGTQTNESEPLNTSALTTKKRYLDAFQALLEEQDTIAEARQNPQEVKLNFQTSRKPSTDLDHESQDARLVPKYCITKVRIQIGESGVECIPDMEESKTKPPESNSVAKQDLSDMQPSSPIKQDSAPGMAENGQEEKLVPGEQPVGDKVRIQLGPHGVECVLEYQHNPNKPDDIAEQTHVEEAPKAHKHGVVPETVGLPPAHSNQNASKQEQPSKEKVAAKHSRPNKAADGNGRRPTAGKPIDIVGKQPVANKINDSAEEHFKNNSFAWQEIFMLSLFIILSLLLFWLLRK